MNSVVSHIKRMDHLRRMILTACYENGGPQHIASALSILGIVDELYSNVMDHDKDHFILSKGHGALALYAVLEDRGIIPEGSLKTIGQKGSILGGHPDRLKVPGVEASTGSLGQGIGMAVGMAYGMKISQKEGRVFCLVGDGELQEGSCWEAIDLAAQLRLPKFHLLVDANNSNKRMWGDLFTSRGLLASWVWPGKIADWCMFTNSSPSAALFETTKGDGIEEMERQPGAWHRAVLNKEKYEKFMGELC